MANTPTVYLLCGLTGAGKSTYAAKLEAQGLKRLALDEAVFESHGRYGVDYPEQEFATHEAEARNQLDDRLVELVRNGESVVLDYGFWSRQDRERYKQLINDSGGECKLLYFKAAPDLLQKRLAARNDAQYEGANQLPVTDEMLEAFAERFEEPSNEGEEIVGDGT